MKLKLLKELKHLHLNMAKSETIPMITKSLSLKKRDIKTKHSTHSLQITVNLANVTNI